jgi:hypothetical protein
MSESQLTPEQLKTLLEMARPSGTIDIWQDSNERGHFFFYGDRSGIIRLGLCLLKYAAEAKIIGTSSKAEGVEEKALFGRASEVQSITLQLDEDARAAAEKRIKRRHSQGIFRRFLSGRAVK